jgi:pimeloyl-ACP methyl ester carboxylesterase
MSVDPQVWWVSLFHWATRAGSRAFSGRFGQVPPTFREPDIHCVPGDEVTLSCLRWPVDSSAIPIVFLHGLNANAWIWARVASVLSERRDAISISLRGHGDSDAPAGGYSSERMARDLIPVLDAFCPRGAVVAGHSWGGRVACDLAAIDPDRVHALVLADPVPPRGLNPLLRTFPGLVNMAFAPERGPYSSFETMEAAGKSLVFLSRWDALDRRFWHACFREGPDRTFRHTLPESAFAEILEAIRTGDATATLDRVECPVLLVRPTYAVTQFPGEDDPFHRDTTRLTTRRISGDHSFIHSNALDTAGMIEEFFVEKKLLTTIP